MKSKTIVIVLLLFLCLTGTVWAGPKPIIQSDTKYFDINTGLYVLKGNVYLQVKNRIITADQARVSVGSLEVWGSGNVTVTQDDIRFTGDSVYVYGAENRATVNGGVSFSRTGLNITADTADFNWRSKIGTFSGNVTVTQDGNTWTTDYLSYNVETNSIL
ncbi:MAG: OstA family protein [Firmicutes bacterium]|nr:OstA family protein [Bacillota bacterium]